MHRRRMEDTCSPRAADLALLERILGDLLDHLERVPFLAAVLVDRHCAPDYSDRASRCASNRWHSRTMSANGCPGERVGRAALLAALSIRAVRLASRRDGHRRRHDGQDRLAVQAARLRLPLERDLRWPRLELRLRPLRRAA